MPTAEDPSANALLAFPSESAPKSEPTPINPVTVTRTAFVPRRRWGPMLIRPVLIGVAIVGALSLMGLVARFVPFARSATGRPSSGNLTIDTRLVPAEVLIDGERRGVSPMTVSLPPGPHTLTVRSEHDQRIVPLTIAAGADVTQYFEMKAAAAPVASLGKVFVTTDPPGARVAIDGLPQGTAPVTIADLTTAQHKITVTSSAGSAERTVAVTPGSTASVVFSLSKASGPVGGWLSVTAPFDVQVLENDEVIGAGGASRIMLAAGSHDILISNRSLGYQEARKIDVSAGKTVAVRVDPPKASISVNARPWAEILVDGNEVGQTPISNLAVTVGTHEVVFRHPQLGERKQTVVVTASGPNRIAVDFTK